MVRKDLKRPKFARSKSGNPNFPSARPGLAATPQDPRVWGVVSFGAGFRACVWHRVAFTDAFRRGGNGAWKVEFEMKGRSLKTPGGWSSSALNRQNAIFLQAWIDQIKAGQAELDHYDPVSCRGILSFGAGFHACLSPYVSAH